MRGVTVDTLRTLDSALISTHTPHARRDMQNCDGSELRDISTHTPHARRDSDVLSLTRADLANFNSHASCEA